MQRTIKNGDHVKYIHEDGTLHDALVKQCWGKDGVTTYDDEKGGMAINLIYVSKQPGKTDGGGQQTEAMFSVSHRASNPGCPGRCWYQE